jgi:hypothetical protein
LPSAKADIRWERERSRRLFSKIIGFGALQAVEVGRVLDALGQVGIGPGKRLCRSRTAMLPKAASPGRQRFEILILGFWL